MPQFFWILFLALPFSVNAEVLFSGRINTGFVYFSAKSDVAIILISNDTFENSYSVTIPTLGLGGTLSYKKLYADLFYTSTLAKGSDPHRAPVPNPLLPTSIETRFNNELGLDEWRLSVGYSLTNQFSLFAGYLYASRSLTTNPDFFLTALPPFTINPAQVRASTAYSFDNQGPFIGFSYGFPLGKGALISSLALGRFKRDSEARISAQGGAIMLTAPDGTQIPVPPTDINLREDGHDGETTALSFSLRYLRPLTKKLALEAGVAGYRYSFDSKQDIIGNVQQSTNSREDYLFLNLGLRYRF